ncbi:MAG: N-methyl-L-tryptophan oxidase [Phenylobacterium sp.]|uniref:N-methyl-L-tryptophan oxidase n=1 Tax=Phenylobacterium sp. TaxID=1871053 RepID=UPI001A539319|nr:N-methyl-L-tryptophan oxidase [Phenylobacterium sp.]MBL8770647.1 N-methyl-L-tryptophan oxidase [Phenylobacterium sp.]
MTRTCDVVVVGLGVMGAAAMASLSRRAAVIGIERAEPGHIGGSSWGESRMIRLSNFENPGYAPLVRRSVELWDDLEQGGEPVFLRVGVLEAGPPDGALMAGTRAAAAAGGFAGEPLTPAEAGERFPAVALPAGWTATLQPGAGLLRADLGVRRLLAAATARGAEMLCGVGVRQVSDTAAGVTVVLDDGEQIQAAAAVITAGQEIAELVPALGPHLRVRPQVLGWYRSERPQLVGPERLPAFAFDDPEGFLYGFPDFAGAGVKAGFHRFDDDPVDPVTEAERVRRHLQRFLGPLAPAHRIGTCGYTITPDEEFVIDRDPDRDNVWFASACSGHGFKFAPAIGEMLADLALGRTPACDPSPYALARFA